MQLTAVDGKRRLYHLLPALSRILVVARQDDEGTQDETRSDVSDVGDDGNETFWSRLVALFVK